MTYTNLGLCHVFQDDTEDGREGFCDRLCQKRRIKSNKTNAVIFPSSMADKMSLLTDDAEKSSFRSMKWFIG